jgi:hypothetical protein
MVALVVAAWVWVAGFYVNYFQCFLETGGLSHKTFHTAAVEPKQAALEYVLAHPRGGKPVRIVCRQWWNYWPIRYLAFHEPAVRVLTWDQWQGEQNRAPRPGPETTWFVEFACTEEALATWRAIGPAGKTGRRHTVVDYARRPLLLVIGPVEKFSQKD